MEKYRGSLKIISALSFVLMIVINILSNKLPINNLTTLEVLSLYPTLITPIVYTYIILLPIYSLLMIFTLYQLDNHQRNTERMKKDYVDSFRKIFIGINIANTAWVIAWHYHYLALALILNIICQIGLIVINKLILSEELTKYEFFIIKLPFRMYLGWITFATATNLTNLLVSIRWKGFGVPVQIWAIVILAILLISTIGYSYYKKSITYCITMIWCFGGILANHISKDGLNSQYPWIITAVTACLFILTILLVYLICIIKKQDQ